MILMLPLPVSGGGCGATGLSGPPKIVAQALPCHAVRRLPGSRSEVSAWGSPILHHAAGIWQLSMWHKREKRFSLDRGTPAFSEFLGSGGPLLGAQQGLRTLLETEEAGKEGRENRRDQEQGAWRRQWWSSPMANLSGLQEVLRRLL